MLCGIHDLSRDASARSQSAHLSTSLSRAHLASHDAVFWCHARRATANAQGEANRAGAGAASSSEIDNACIRHRFAIHVASLRPHASPRSLYSRCTLPNLPTRPALRQACGIPGASRRGEIAADYAISSRAAVSLDRRVTGTIAFGTRRCAAVITVSTIPISRLTSDAPQCHRRQNRAWPVCGCPMVGLGRCVGGLRLSLIHI